MLTSRQVRLGNQLYLNMEQLAGYIDTAGDIGCDYILSRVTSQQASMINFINTANVSVNCAFAVTP